MFDGHLNFCKPCVKARVKTHRRENDSVREYDRNRPRPEGWDLTEQERQRRRRAQYPIKSYASQLVYRAIKKGQIMRQPCEECGSERADAHHDDYSKPYDVRFLCPLHHRRWHAVNEASYPVPF